MSIKGKIVRGAARLAEEVGERLGVAGARRAAPRKAPAKKLAVERPAAKAKKAPAKKPAVDKPKGTEGRKSIIRTPDLRVKSRDDAIATARREPHLIRDAKSKTYVGGPRKVRSKQALNKQRAAFDADVDAGASGADWYTRAREFNKEIAGPDPARQRLAAQEQALWSAQATPDSNLNFALQGHNAYEMGTPLAIVRDGQKARTYNAARDAGTEIPLGPKTGVYGQHLDPTMPHATTGTNDIWHARGFGYENADGSLFDRALTPQEHRFLDYETMLAVDRANARQMGGRSDWEAHEIQAAPWVAGKGRALAAQKGTPDADGIELAAMTYPDYADKFTAYATHEQVPFAEGRHLSDMAGQPADVRAAYSAAPEAQWIDESGRDSLYDAIGLYQRPALDATGAYTPPGGAMEFNPLKVSRPLVGLPGGTGAVDSASSNAMNLAEGTRAYLDAQGAGAWHKLVPNAKPGNAGTLNIPYEGDFGEEQLAQLMAIGNKYGLGDVIHRGDGVTMTNFYPGVDGAHTRNALKNGLAEDLAGALPGAVPERVGMDSGYASMFENVGEDGAVTRQLLDMLDRYGTPEAIGKIEASDAVRAKALGNVARDERFAAELGMDVDERVQNARRIFAGEGFAGLRSALDKGLPLPAILPLASLPAMEDYAAPEQ